MLILIQWIYTEYFTLFTSSTDHQFKWLWLEVRFKTNQNKKQKYMLLIAGCKLNVLWTRTSFSEPGSTMKSTHDGKHSLSKKDFPNTAKLWGYCLQLKLFFSSTVNHSYPQGDSDGLLSSPSPRRNWVSTVWIQLSIVFLHIIGRT